MTEEDHSELAAFADAEEIDLFHTAGEFERLEIEEPDEGIVPLRLVGERGVYFGLWNAAGFLERARRRAAALNVDEHPTYRALVLAAAAEELETDGFVTRRDVLLAEGTDVPANVFAPEEALALIGLALRLHGNTTAGADLGNTRLGSWWHFVLTRDLLREGWRWFSACVAHRTATGEDTALNLGWTTHERFRRVLQIRDRLHAQAKAPSGRAVADELVFQLEALLLFLSASFDAAARVAHLAYFDGAYERAGWRRERWHAELSGVDRELADLVADGSRGGTLLRLISLLRNTIHGEALQTIDLRLSGAPPENPIGLSPREAAKITVHIASLGGAGPEAWGLREHGGRTYLKPDRFARSTSGSSTRRRRSGRSTGGRAVARWSLPAPGLMIGAARRCRRRLPSCWSRMS
jgi:hypothetical protein